MFFSIKLIGKFLLVLSFANTIAGCNPLINKSNSGLMKSRKILNKIKEIKTIEFDHRDVVRHPLVSKIIQAYQKNIDDKN